MRTASSGERLVRIIDEHWIRYVPPIFLGLLFGSIGLLLFYLAGLSAHHNMWLSHVTLFSALVLVTVANHWFFYVLLSEAVGFIVITDRRIIFIYTRLLVRESMQEISFDKMKRVQASKRGLIQNLFRYGSLHFEGGADIELVPHPNRVVRDIELAMGLR